MLEVVIVDFWCTQGYKIFSAREILSILLNLYLMNLNLFIFDKLYYC